MRRPLLVLDLDETLIHASPERLGREEDFRIGPYFVYTRPHLTAFLQQVAIGYDLAIWSSASIDYVNAIARSLAHDVAPWQFVWARDRCVQRFHAETRETYFLKDLKKVKRRGYPLNQILIVDDTPLKFWQDQSVVVVDAV